MDFIQNQNCFNNLNNNNNHYNQNNLNNLNNSNNHHNQNNLNNNNSPVSDTDFNIFIDSEENNPIVKGIQHWNSVDVQGTVPWARCWFGSALISGQLFIFGGYSGKKVFLSDLHILDLEQLKWKEVQALGKVPAGRYAFSFTPNQDGSKIYLFGGATGKIYFNDVYTLNTKNFIWTRLKTTGPTPTSRCGHTATMVGKNLYIQGGDRGTGQYMDDLYILDTEKQNFILINTSQKKLSPPPRGWHTVVAIEDSLYYFGGVTESNLNSKFHDIWVFRTQTFEWELLKTSGRIPPKRYSHTTVSGGSDIAIVGGKYKQGGDIEVYWLNIDLMCWWQPNINGIRPPNRYAHSTVIYKGKLYLFGGFDSEKTFNDLYVLDIETDPQVMSLEPPSVPQLNNDMKALVNSPIFSDIKFIVEGKKIYAHRNILVARSVYFSKMLLGPLQESQIQEVQVTEAQYNTFLNFLVYIYSENISFLDINEALELLAIANRYQHDKLKLDLSFMIEQYLVVDNCCLLLEYAYHSEALTLKNVCLNFIKKNLQAVKRTPAFSSIKHLLVTENKNL